MLKDRKVYLTLRELEKKDAGVSPVDFKVLISTLLEKNKCSPPWMTFSDEKEVRRVFQSLVGQGYALHERYSLGNSFVQGVKTMPNGDTHFSFPYFLSKWVDEWGFWKILTLLLGLLSFVPNGVASKLIDLIIALSHRQ